MSIIASYLYIINYTASRRNVKKLPLRKDLFTQKDTEKIFGVLKCSGSSEHGNAYSVQGSYSFSITDWRTRLATEPATLAPLPPFSTRTIKA